METEDFFDVSQPIDRETFLKITREILQASLLVLAPFGLPGQFRQAVRTENMFVRKYGPRFRFILESASEKVYEARGVSESEVAVTVHKYIEEEKDAEVLACLAQTNEALRSIYSPPRLLELPYVLPVEKMTRSGLSMLHAGAIYVPESVKCIDDTPSKSSLTGKALGESTSGDADALSPDVACEARSSNRLQEPSIDAKTHGDVSTSRGNVSLVPDHEKIRRAKVAACLDAMTALRRGTEGFLEPIEQPHLQAMTEAFSASRDSSAVVALDEIAVMPFIDNELLMLVRALEKRRERKMGELSPDVEGTPQEDLEARLESLLSSQFYRMIAEQYLEEDLPHQAARWYDEAYNVGASILPARCKAELLAERARCYLLHDRDFEAAISNADAALALDAACGEAFLVRGQCNRALGNDQGALGDLVKAFILRGIALNGMTTDNMEAQAIEEVSREACKARALEAFSNREATTTFPADWVVRSYLASYNREDLYSYSEQENSAYLQHSEGEETLNATCAFWRGVNLMQKGRFIESMEHFAKALDAEEPQIKSLALEHYGSFQYLQRDMKGALESFRCATVADATNVKCWVKKGSVLNDLGRSEEAFECFREAQKIDPRDPDIYLHRGQGHLLANGYRKAVMDLKKSVDLCPTMPMSWATWGIALFKLGTTDEQSSSSVSQCLEVMEDALERFPENSEVLLFFAEVLVSMGNFARGLELLKRSALLDPGCPLPYVNAARAYLGMNDLAAARRHLERGQELDSTYPGTFMDMGQLLMQEGFPARALSMYKRGVETARFPSEIHEAMASLEVAKYHLEAQRLLPL